MVSRRLPTLISATLLANLSLGATSRADEPPASDARTEADEQFNEGKQLMDAGQIGAACARFARSEELDPKLGRLLNLAFCHEEEGKTASAWSEYNGAAALADKKGQDERAEFARDHAATVARSLSFVHFTVPTGATAMEVDGTGIARDKWTTPLPFDPGEHQVVAHALGRKDRTTAFVVGATPGIQELELAPFEDERPPPQPEAVALPRTAGHGAAFVAGGIAAAGLSVGVAFGVVALSKRDEANPDCPHRVCDAAGGALISQARSAAVVSDVGFGVALGGAAVATWLLLWPRGARTIARWIPFVGSTGSGLALRGSW